MAKIRIGTCSWKYPSWKGLVYSDNAKKNYLLEYARHYDTVEIDQWFWSLFENDLLLPKEEVVQEYSESVPADFRFTIKAPNSITLTHFYQKDKNKPLVKNPNFLSTDLYREFLDTLRPLGSKIGMIMLQFEYMNKQKMPSTDLFFKSLAAFIEKCDRTYPLALEVRNPWYLNQRYFRFLNIHKWSNVFLQGYFMPPVSDIYARYWKLIEAPTVIRLHGPTRSDIEKKSGGIWDRILEPKDEEISRISRIIQELNSKNLDVYVNVNNHYEGSAPLTIERLRDILNIPTGTG